MKTLLWLDDYRNPYKLDNDWVRAFSPFGTDCKIIWVKSYKQFVNWITYNKLPDAICFDHDLGNDKTGYDCAKWLVDYCIDNDKKLPIWNCQSANPVGKDNINSLLNNYKIYMNKVRGFEFISKEQQIKDNFRTTNPHSLPKRATALSAGYDCFAPFEFTLEPGQDIKVPTGIKSYMLCDEVLFALPRSGHGFKFYIRLANTQGVIDAKK